MYVPDCHGSVYLKIQPNEKWVGSSMLNYQVLCSQRHAVNLGRIVPVSDNLVIGY